MPVYKTYFNGKKITLMGLGLLGRGVGDAMFLAEQGATLMVTDLRDEKILAPSLAKLEKYKDIRYQLGEHRREDFLDKDFILKAAGVPLNSPYIAEAKRRGISIEMDASLFAKLMPKGVVLVGVTGTRGKSTTAECIYAILKAAKKRVFLGGVVHTATLSLLTKVRSGDIVVLELDSWQLQGFHDAKLSPHIAVFTTFMDDHLLYYKGDRKKYFEDKSAIFRYQKRGDVLVVGEQAAGKIKNQESKIKMVVARASDIPRNWKQKLPGEHNRENVACAVAAARALGISESVIRRTVEAFRGVPGRLEYLRTVRLPAACLLGRGQARGLAQAGGVKIYNDNNATTPDATIAALRALNSNIKIPNHKQIPISKSQTDRKIILICGGTDKGLDMSGLIAEIPKHCKAVVFLKETGTEKLISNFPAFAEAASAKAGRQFPRLPIGGQAISNKFSIFKKNTLKGCVEQAIKIAQKGDIVLFSPAFASFGKWFKNEYDRGEQFVGLIRRL